MDVTQVGPYSITRELGRGGMGVVYLARDPRLDRDVAIKSLPRHLAADPDRLGRFQREAKVLAQLNHPNVAGIHGLEEHEGAKYLVLEFVAGETLASRLDRGPIPLDETLEFASQIAAGVEAAHNAGVIHRDLKPGNIILTPDGHAKVLDFGLARTAEAGSVISSPSGDARPDSATVTNVAAHSPTMPGVILGTAAYMSPEQARGRRVDRRSDVWSFGVILYEMLTGVSPFAGETITDTIATVVKGPLPTEQLPASIPPSIARVLSRCLRRDPAGRYHSVADAALDLREAPAEPAAPLRRRAGIPWASLALIALLAGALIWQVLRPATIVRDERPARRFQLADVRIPPDPFNALAISPDGNLIIARQAIEGQRLGLLLHDLRDGTREAVSITPGSGWAPEFSPDGSRVMALLDGELRLIDVQSQTSAAVAVPPTGFHGGGWMDDGSYIYASADSPELYRVNVLNGELERIDLRALEITEAVATPTRVRGRNAVLVTIISDDRAEIIAIDLDAMSKHMVANNGNAPIHTNAGHVIYQTTADNAEVLVAAPFDAGALKVTGTPIALARVARRSSVQERAYSASDEGTLVYLPPRGADAQNQTELAWLDRDGTFTPIQAFDHVLDTPRLSPDETRIAFRVPSANCSIHIHDIERDATTLITRGGDSHGVVWTDDGNSILTTRQYDSGWSLYSLPADGSSAGKRLNELAMPRAVTTGFVPDTNIAVIALGANTRNGDIGLLDLDAEALETVLDSDADEDGPILNPAGTVIAYWSDVSGERQVYIRRFPFLDQRVQVSTDGGDEPWWSDDGSTLYFRSGDRLLSVEITEEPALSAGSAALVVEAAFLPGGLGLAGYDVTADGNRIIIARSTNPLGGGTIEVVTNWTDLLNSPRSTR